MLSAVFFFQAEDGIRDGHVTGVQTCALPIFDSTLEQVGDQHHHRIVGPRDECRTVVNRSRNIRATTQLDRKSTRLNSSHVAISYAVFCLKKKIMLNF